MKNSHLPRHFLLVMALCVLILIAGCSAEKSGPSSTAKSAAQNTAVTARDSDSGSVKDSPTEAEQEQPEHPLDEVLYLPLGQSWTLSLDDREAGAYLHSTDPDLVRADGNTITGEGVGVVELELRSSQDKVLNRTRVYCFRPTVLSRGKGKNTREHPADLIAQCGDVRRVYPLVCQQKQMDKPYGVYLSRHGCTTCCAADVCQAMGAKNMTVDWLMTGGLEKIAKADGRTLEDDSLGYYGLQKVLEYGDISSKIYCTWKGVPAAAEEMVQSLSEGRPILLYLDNKAEWNGMGPLCVELHCVVLAGISEDGYLQIINNSYPHKENWFYNRKSGKFEFAQLKPEELLEHFLRTTHTERKKKNDFYFTKKGGMHTFVEVTCQSAQVRE